jgi:competence ComEA-like helix-hairpin-helix protein
MFYKSGPLIVALLGIGSIARGQATQGTQPLPEGRGKAEFARICAQCHGIEVVTKVRMGEDGWSGVVDDMISRGAQGTQDEFDRVAKYLTTHFGPNNPVVDPNQSAASKVNLNKASEKDLSSILGLSAEDAQAIVHYRDTAGGFTDWQDLRKVPHIDMKKLADQKDRIDFSQK